MAKKGILSLMFFVSGLAHAWGPVGHRTVGLVAEDHLNQQARRAVSRLLGRETLASVASWADAMRGQGKYRQTSWYHIEKIPDDWTYLQNLRAQSDTQKKKGGIVAAILYGRELLRIAKAPQAEQADALKFMVHFVGDIHQPLHTGRAIDKGGLTLDVDWFGRSMHLHRVWDSGMIYTAHKEMHVFSETEEPETEADRASRYKKVLNEKFGRENFDVELNVEGWLNESMRIRPRAYDPSYQHDQNHYQELNAPGMDKQIYIAGLRLAALINDVYGNKPLPPREIKLKDDIESIIGRLDEVISFRP